VRLPTARTARLLVIELITTMRFGPHGVGGWSIIILCYSHSATGDAPSMEGGIADERC
jgi:hypothetical protein